MHSFFSFFFLAWSYSYTYWRCAKNFKNVTKILVTLAKETILKIFSPRREREKGTARVSFLSFFSEVWQLFHLLGGFLTFLKKITIFEKQIPFFFLRFVCVCVEIFVQNSLTLRIALNGKLYSFFLFFSI